MEEKGNSTDTKIIHCTKKSCGKFYFYFFVKIFFNYCFGNVLGLFCHVVCQFEPCGCRRLIMMTTNEAFSGKLMNSKNFKAWTPEAIHIVEVCLFLPANSNLTSSNAISTCFNFKYF
jgi:hypothetical protein